MKRSMLDLSFMENATDDLLDSPINEGTEGTENNIETDPIESTKVDVPGGDKEEPSKQGIKLDADTYNNALDALQKSFNEGAQIAAMLKNAQITEDSLESKQAQFTEAAIEDALLASLENGPMFESVEKNDKNPIKEIVTNIRKTLFKYLLNEKNVESIQPKVIARILFGGFTGFRKKVQKSGTVSGEITTWVNTRLWQVLAVMYVDADDSDDIIDDLNVKYKDILGDYKIIAYEMIPALSDLFRTSFGWKNKKQTYMLFVDKSLPKKEAKELENALMSSMKDDKK